MTRPHYQMILHMALYPLLRRDGKVRSGSRPELMQRSKVCTLVAALRHVHTIGTRSFAVLPWKADYAVGLSTPGEHHLHMRKEIMPETAKHGDGATLGNLSNSNGRIQVWR